MAPVVVFVTIELAEVVAKNVSRLPAPAVASVVTVQAVAQRLIGGLLHLAVQRGVNAQAALVTGFGPLGRFQILANLFEEIRRQVVARILQMQAKRRFLCSVLFAGA